MPAPENARQFGLIGTWELNLKTGRLIWSANTFSIFGLPEGSPQDFATFLDRIHPDDREEFKVVQRQAIDRQQTMDCIHRLVRPAGGIRFVREVGALFGTCRPEIFHGAVQDITEMLAHALKVESSEKLLGLAGRKARLGGWRYVLGEQHVHWSDATAAIHELPPGTSPTVDEAIAFYDLDSQDRIRSALSECVAVGKHYDEVLTIITRSGKRLAVRAIGEPELDPRGKIIAVFGAFQDVSELVDAKEKTHKATALLEDRIRQTERLEAVGLMTGGVAHDFNNLLTVILGNAESLTLALPKDDQLRPLVEMMVMAAERGAEMTNRLLAFSRRQPLQSIPADINALLKGMVGLLRRAVPAHVEIELSLGEGSLVTQIDPGQLEVAVLNLVINAKDAIKLHGRILIETKEVIVDEQYVGGRSKFVHGSYLLLSVTDDGTGMPAHVAERAFDPFFTTKSVGHGSGLGLSMVYGIVMQSGGQATIYSEVGKGTSVKMFLPRSDQAAALAPMDPPSEAANGCEHILVVEDDVLVRQHVTATLTDLGYKTTSASSSEDALNALRNIPDIELLFTDMVMPGGMNGRELADRARARHPALKVIFTSGYTEEAVVGRSWLNSGVHFLSKPYKRNELTVLLRRVFQK